MFPFRGFVGIFASKPSGAPHGATLCIPSNILLAAIQSAPDTETK